jgi:diaminohydroxyphosphoribosylaminopyrimidine deaminase/5-amino-6-(5-phosphoribosylamino)uracil reductase
MTDEADRRFMALALSLGRRGLGRVWPNPAVGCVIVGGPRHRARLDRDGGPPHAETVALDQAGEAARGATAYVTWSPATTPAQTPPCSEALIAAGVARVVTALEDPDPRVAGRGHACLQASGVAVTTGVLADEAAWIQAGFLCRVTRGRPLVTLKLAATLDGRIATQSGESRWITGPQARRAVHLMRATHDAVMVGRGTAMADDPALTVRDLGIARQPVRVLVDSAARTSPDGRLGRTAEDAPVWLCHGPAAPAAALDAWRRRGARLLACRAGPGGLDRAAVLAALGQAGLTRVLCEGGAGLAAGLIGAGLADRLALFTAGKAIGASGHPALGPLGLPSLAAAPRFDLLETRDLGGDVLSLWDADPGSMPA